MPRQRVQCVRIHSFDQHSALSRSVFRLRPNFWSDNCEWIIFFASPLNNIISIEFFSLWGDSEEQMVFLYIFILCKISDSSQPNLRIIPNRKHLNLSNIIWQISAAKATSQLSYATVYPSIGIEPYTDTPLNQPWILSPHAQIPNSLTCFSSPVRGAVPTAE